MKAMLYLADLLPRLQEIAGVIAFFSAATIAIGYVFCSDLLRDADLLRQRSDEMAARHKKVYDSYKRIARRAGVIFAVSFAFALLTPSKTTLYLITGITLAEAALEHSADSELLDLTKRLMIQQLSEGPQAED